MKAAIAPAPDLKAELDMLNAELSDLRGRLSPAQAALHTLIQERSTIAERIAAGQEKPAAASEIERRLEQIRASVDGLKAIIKGKEARAREIQPAVRSQEALQLRAEREATMRKLEAAGAEIVATINEKLYSILGVDLMTFDAIRDQLIKDFQDVGGFGAQNRLVKLLVVGDLVCTAEAKLKEEGLKRRSDIRINLHNLARPNVPRAFPVSLLPKR